MGAMQGTSMSGLMNGSGGGARLGLGWLCGFNIPLITICAFFVLNIFLELAEHCFLLAAVHQDLHSVSSASSGRPITDDHDQTYQDPIGWPFLPYPPGRPAHVSRRSSRACAIPSG